MPGNRAELSQQAHQRPQGHLLPRPRHARRPRRRPVVRPAAGAATAGANERHILWFGTEFILSPETATLGFGLPSPPSGGGGGFLITKGVRDVVLALVLGILCQGGPARAPLARAGPCWPAPTGKASRTAAYRLNTVLGAAMSSA
ncbi:DUF4267 domain-containing protein [Actinomadura violacea]|uniref:DUF4267 domain-containing protein n=1 Tax=Actinomadura violacea TaxID=2819934 RepID=UPI0035591619